MNSPIKTSIFALGLVFSMNALGSEIKVGDRVFALGRNEFPKKGKPLMRRQLGAGTVKVIKKDGTIVFENDAHVLADFKGDSKYDLMPLAQCGTKPGETYFSTQKYFNEKTSPNNSFEIERTVGSVSVKEVFGTCKLGYATIISKDAEAPKVVAFASLVNMSKKVSCDFQKTKVSSSAPVEAKLPITKTISVVGAGTALEVYGDCKTGVVKFRADRNVSETILIPASSITQSVVTQKSRAQTALQTHSRTVAQ